MTTLFDKNDTVAVSDMENYENRTVILKPEFFNEKFRSAKYQLFQAVDGFGCDPSKMGTAVFGYFCFDGVEARVSRSDILGIATFEAIAEWNKLYGDEAVKIKNNKINKGGR